MNQSKFDNTEQDAEHGPPVEHDDDDARRLIDEWELRRQQEELLAERARRFKEKTIELLEHRALVEEQRKQTLVEEPVVVRSAIERTQVNESRQHILRCLRLLERHTAQYTYTARARLILQQEYTRLTDAIETFDRRGFVKPQEDLRQMLEKLPLLLIAERFHKRLTQRDIAERTGISRSRINRYEKTLFSQTTLQKMQIIADAIFKSESQ